MRFVLGAAAALFLSANMAHAMCGDYKSATLPQTTVADGGHPTSTPVILPSDKKS